MSITGFNPGFFLSENDKNTIIIDNPELLASTEEKKKRGRPPKKKDTDIIVSPKETSSRELTMLESKEPYYDTFNNTNFMLNGAIQQLDALNNEVSEQINIIKNSKTIKNKYNYLSNLSEVSSSIINSKISAIRELNSVIKTCHDLELKRVKELKMDQSSSNDDQRLMDMYNAYISTPIGHYSIAANPIDMVTAGASSVYRAENPVTSEQMIFDDYQNNMTPEQNNMLLMDNPNIKTVVVYDQGTGARHFDVVDMSTGLSVPNMPVPDSSFLDDTTINVKTGTARNANINMNYPLIVVGENPMSKF